MPCFEALWWWVSSDAKKGGYCFALVVLNGKWKKVLEFFFSIALTLAVPMVLGYRVYSICAYV